MDVKETKGKVFDIQGFSMHDGPGIRTTVFLKGCPLRCPWCHSPESQSFDTQLCYMKLRCAGTEHCGRCLPACPHNALTADAVSQTETEGVHIRAVRWDRKKCENCGACAKRCYNKALYLCGEDMLAAQVMERLRADLPFFKKSGGGLTISGGEALCQPEFTAALLHAAHAEAIHTALDTTGFAEYDVIRAMLPDIDLFLYDLKHMDSAIHKKLMGVPNERILKNAERLSSAGAKLWIRIPVIPGFNDSERNIEESCLFLKTIRPAVHTVQLLPFHNFGAAKYERIQMESRMPADTEAPTEHRMSEIAAAVENSGFRVMIH
jgi:pyruvate formate lyase activating enzyme